MSADRPSGSSPLERIPPQDLEAEMALLGAMMLDRETIGDVTSVIHRNESERFYRPDHRRIFEVLMDLYERGDPVDLVSVRNELSRLDILEDVGGVPYITQLAESVPNYLHAEYYARLVRDKAMLRDLIGATAKINDSAYEQGDDAKEILDLLNEKTGRSFKPVDANLKPIMARIREYDADTVRQVIANKCADWMNNPRLSEYLRPKTLFAASNFANYEGALDNAH